MPTIIVVTGFYNFNYGNYPTNSSSLCTDYHCQLIQPLALGKLNSGGNYTYFCKVWSGPKSNSIQEFSSLWLEELPSDIVINNTKHPVATVEAILSMAQYAALNKTNISYSMSAGGKYIFQTSDYHRLMTEIIIPHSPRKITAANSIPCNCPMTLILSNGCQNSLHY